eukprot:GILK01012598.1.p1 GENE.GILK01012598.1~~GILK01012598.1.p1  ORF type:complete len:207 (-),score=16.66 GILK01012598.1:52-672(-)
MWRPVTLIGKAVRLEPLQSSHVPALMSAHGVETTQYFPQPVQNMADMQQFVDAALQLQSNGLALPFVTIDTVSNLVVGTTRFGNIDTANRRAEIGWTWIGSKWRRSAVNTEAKLLMLQHGFETEQCARIEFKTDALNVTSRAAIARLGAKEEATLRKHILTASGRWRDTVYFSILDTEWADVRSRLNAMLVQGCRKAGAPAQVAQT